MTMFAESQPGGTDSAEFIPGSPAVLPADPGDSGRAYESPEWNPGDWWRYNVVSEEDIVMTMSGIQINLEELDETTIRIVQQQENVVVNGSAYEVYNSTVEIRVVQSGTWSYMGSSGDFFDESTSKGYVYHRTSDLAMVKQVLDLEGNARIPGVFNSPYHGSSVSTATPPLNIFRFPMTPPNTWTVNSIVVQDAVVVQGGNQESETIIETHNYLNTVGMEKSGTAAGVGVDYYPIHQVGTITVPGNTMPVNGYINYSAQVKNSIDNLTGFGDVDSQMSDDVDLKVAVSDITISPESPRENDRLEAAVRISNLGGEPVIGAEVKVTITDTEYVNGSTIISMNGGEELILIYDLGCPGGGEFDIMISLDPDDAIPEQNENNNVAQRTVSVAVNHPPVVHSREPFSDIIINKGTSVSFVVNASDEDDDDFSYAWTLNGEILPGENERKLDWDFTEVSQGDLFEVEVKLVDELGANATATWEVTINSAPKINLTVPSQPLVNADETEEVLFHVQFQNAGESNVIFKWYLDGRLLTDAKSAFFNFVTRVSGPNSSEDSPYEITVVVEDFLGLSDRFTWTVTVLDLNEPPVILSAMADASMEDTPDINETEYIKFNVTAVDPNGDLIGYSWFVDGEVVSDAGRSDFIYTSDHDTVEHHIHGDRRVVNVTVRAEDGVYNASYTWSLTIVDRNRPMTLVSFLPAMDTLGNITVNDRIEFNASFTDPDGDELKYQWYDGNMKLTVDQAFDLSFEAGNRSVKLVVSDGYGSSVTRYANFTVLPESGNGGKTSTPIISDEGTGSWIFIIAGLVVIIIAGVIVFMILRKKKGEKGGDRVNFIEDGSIGGRNEIFLCPRCNEKADKDLGYCMDCGHSFPK